TRFRSDFVTPLASSHARIARRTCSETATPSRSHTSCSPSSRSWSMRNVVTVRATLACFVTYYIVIQRITFVRLLLSASLHASTNVGAPAHPRLPRHFGLGRRSDTGRPDVRADETHSKRRLRTDGERRSRPGRPGKLLFLPTSAFQV